MDFYINGIFAASEHTTLMLMTLKTAAPRREPSRLPNCWLTRTCFYLSDLRSKKQGFPAKGTAQSHFAVAVYQTGIRIEEEEEGVTREEEAFPLLRFLPSEGGSAITSAMQVESFAGHGRLGQLSEGQEIERSPPYEMMAGGRLTLGRVRDTDWVKHPNGVHWINN